MIKKQVQRSSIRHRPAKWIVYLNGAAAILMFASWLFQNIWQTDLSARKADAERNVQFVNSEMSKAISWMLAYQAERRKQSPDAEVILNTATNYDATTLRIVEAAGRVDPNSAVLKSHVADHVKISIQLAKAVKARNLEGLEDATDFLMAWFGQMGPEADQAMNRGFQTLSDKEDMAEWFFRIFFIVASVVFAITWWGANMKTNGPHSST